MGKMDLGDRTTRVTPVQDIDTDIDFEVII